MTEIVGLIAGQGRLPVLVAQGIRASGRKVACIGLRDQFDAQLPDLCDKFSVAGIVQLGRWMRTLRNFGATETIMVGRVRKARMYEPMLLLRQLPDWRATRLWYRKLRHDKRNDKILGAVADELATAGIILIDSTRYIPDQLAGSGTLTRTRPSSAQEADVNFGLPIVARMGELDIGQSIAVRDREIIAVEAIEGTDKMIRRAGELCRKGQWTLIKTGKPGQDMRFDVPTIGMQTLENMKAAGATCLAVEAGKVILLDKPDLLATADKMGIAIVGVQLDPSAAA